MEAGRWKQIRGVVQRWQYVEDVLKGNLRLTFAFLWKLL
jgi:hypothetical protein